MTIPRAERAQLANPLRPQSPTASSRAQFAALSASLRRLVNLRAARICLVQSISCFRLLATLVFACLAFKDVSRILVSGLYAAAIVSDLLDGYLSRKLKAETFFGKILDLIADKSLTVVSLLYAAARGIDVLPLAMIATRDLVMIGMRLVVVEEVQLLPTSRAVGGAMAAILWGNTFILMQVGNGGDLVSVANVVYWVCAVFFALNLIARLYKSAGRIKFASTR